MTHRTEPAPQSMQIDLDQPYIELGPFVVAAQSTQLATAFTDGQADRHPVLLANDAFLALTGFVRADVVDQPIEQVLANLTDATTVSSIATALTERQSGAWEMQCRRADGGEFLAALYLSPLRDTSGVVRQNALSLVKLGGHVERLLDQRNEFHAIYEQAPGFIATSEGPDHRFTFANASYKRFVGREELVGLTVAEALPEIADQGFIALLDKVYRTGKPFVGYSMPMALVDPASGETKTRYCDFVYQAVRDAKNTIVGLFCEGYDVTTQRETADALAALQADVIHVSRVNAMGTMATTLAHELNQPLSAIANYAAGALKAMEGQGERARVAEALRGIDEASQRAAEIIRNLRELTRRRDPAKTAFDLKVAVGECVRLVRPTVPPGVGIIDAIPAGTMVAGDRVQIQQVVINLLRNACDAVAASSRQEVVIGAIDQYTQQIVCVTDTGPGVPLEAARSIFSWGDSAKEGGMGMGLSICQTIMESHRGRIWLERSGPDGSEFRFSLPRAVDPSPTP